MSLEVKAVGELFLWLSSFVGKCLFGSLPVIFESSLQDYGAQIHLYVLLPSFRFSQ